MIISSVGQHMLLMKAYVMGTIWKYLLKFKMCIPFDTHTHTNKDTIAEKTNQ